MNKKESELVRKFLQKIGKKGGQRRAEKYDTATLRKWAKKGGRPKKDKTEERGL